MPDTRPLLLPTVAVVVIDEDQVPPGDALDNNVVLPTHILVMPVIGEGAAITFMFCNLKQPVLPIA